MDRIPSQLLFFNAVSSARDARQYAFGGNEDSRAIPTEDASRRIAANANKSLTAAVRKAFEQCVGPPVVGNPCFLPFSQRW